MERALLDLEQIRSELEEAVGERRARAGLEELVSEPAVTRAAQDEARAIADRVVAGMRLEQATEENGLETRLVSAGYEPYAFTAAVAASDAEPTSVVNRWMGEGAERGELWRRDLPDIGIGIAESGELLIYLVVLARSAADWFGETTAALESLDEVRAALRVRVNKVRGESMREPVLADACLDRVAQGYARRLLAEGFFEHTDPSGGDVAARARQAGCRHQPVGENLAQGPTAIDAVIEGWLASPGHRRVLMDQRFDAMGLGLATGRGPNGYQVVWVQVMGRRP